MATNLALSTDSFILQPLSEYQRDLVSLKPAMKPICFPPRVSKDSAEKSVEPENHLASSEEFAAKTLA